MAKPNGSMRAASFLAAALLCLLGCQSRPVETPDQRLRRQAAEDAAQVHHDVKQAGREARQALSAAGRETRDIVAGAREGWRDGAAKDGPLLGSGEGSKPGSKAGSPGRDAVDINHASARELQRLPGIDQAIAARIVGGQPYRDPAELERQGLVTRAEYRRIAPRLVAR